MMTTLRIAGLTAILISTIAPPMAIGQTAPVPVAAPAVAKKAATDPRIDSNAIVCKSEDTTGTRLGAKKVCLTRQQWADMAAESRERLQKDQNLSRTH